MAEENRAGRSREMSTRLVELLEWPGGIARLAAALCAGVATLVLLYEVPHTIGNLGDEAGRSAALSYADRDIAGGNSILVDQVAAYQARAIIPVGETFRVVIGPHLQKTTPLTLQAVSGWLNYFLMPRRQAGNADWIVCYGCNQNSLGGSYHTLWSDDVGISIGRVR